MRKSIFAIALGAAIGALLRWLLGLKLDALSPAMPPGILAANLISGCVIGRSVVFFSALPRLHVGDWSATSAGERIALFARADAAKVGLDREFHADGYNLGINVGEAAGKTLFHVHLHMIPCYPGNVPDLCGGERGMIPSKPSY
jgi:hypothetical protein